MMPINHSHQCLAAVGPQVPAIGDLQRLGDSRLRGLTPRGSDANFGHSLRSFADRGTGTHFASGQTFAEPLQALGRDIRLFHAQ